MEGPGSCRRVMATDSVPGRRAVLLGASNLVRGLATVIGEARAAWGSPLDLLVAIGYGRSYGMESRVLARSLPGIITCDLWEALAERSPLPTAVLVTDVGNDLLYGATPDLVALWLERCLSRLRGLSEHMVMTELPMASLERTGPWRYRVMRAILFPSSKLGYREALHRARVLNRHVRQLARRYEARLITPCPLWYGIDPIHIRRRHCREAWRDVFSHWGVPRQSASRCLRLRERIMLWRARPQQRWLFGVEQLQSQPAAVFADGTRLSLY